jgi:lysophospholipase L1-like esterase
MNEMKNAIMITTVLTLCALTVQASGNTNIVVMLGDSTTLCYENKPGYKLTDFVQSYLTQKHLKARIVNSGVGGDTAKGGFGRLQSAVLVHEPAVVTISFGLNDMGGSTPDEYRDCMEKIVQSVQTNTHAKILLITSTPFNNARHAWGEKFRTKGGMDEYMDANFCAAERALAKKYNLTLCDLHDHFIALFKKNPKLIDELILPDGVHLTDKGNAVAAKYVAPSIAGLLAKPGNNKKKGNAP